MHFDIIALGFKLQIPQATRDESSKMIFFCFPDAQAVKLKLKNKCATVNVGFI